MSPPPSQAEEVTGMDEMSEEAGRPASPRMGERFPHMRVRTTRGVYDLPDQLSGGWFILFSHPADFTPVCTTEFIAFAKRYERFRELGCQLMGHSIDSVFSHIKWEEWIEERFGVAIPFPIIADPHTEVARKLGIMHPISGVGSVRAVFVVDGSGMIVLIMYYPPRVGRNVEEILRIMRALRLAERHEVAIPANWPDNEIIGDEVLLEPPMDVDGAKRRRGGKGCDDWWFCHKKVEY